MNKKSISAIILTYNEEQNLEACLKSIAGLVSQIIVVDSYSSDKTLEIAKKFGARIEQRRFTNQAEQFNWAIDTLEIKGDWILRLDADEWLTPELSREIADTLSRESAYAGFMMKRRVYFMGNWIKHGGYYPVSFLRLFKKGVGRSEVREMDEHIILHEGNEIGTLKNDFVDENHNGLARWIEKHKNYAEREARAYVKELHAEGGARERSAKLDAYYKLPIFLRPFLYFVYRYIIRLGFLDGVGGLVFHFLQGFWYRFLIDIKIYQISK